MVLLLYRVFITRLNVPILHDFRRPDCVFFWFSDGLNLP